MREQQSRSTVEPSLSEDGFHALVHPGLARVTLWIDVVDDESVSNARVFERIRRAVFRVVTLPEDIAHRREIEVAKQHGRHASKQRAHDGNAYAALARPAGPGDDQPSVIARPEPSKLVEFGRFDRSREVSESRVAVDLWNPAHLEPATDPEFGVLRARFHAKFPVGSPRRFFAYRNCRAVVPTGAADIRAPSAERQPSLGVLVDDRGLAEDFVFTQFLGGANCQPRIGASQPVPTRPGVPELL